MRFFRIITCKIDLGIPSIHNTCSTFDYRSYRSWSGSTKCWSGSYEFFYPRLNMVDRRSITCNRPKPKWFLNWWRALYSEKPLKMHVSTTKARCSLLNCFMATKKSAELALSTTHEFRVRKLGLFKLWNLPLDIQYLLSQKHFLRS